MNGTVCWSKITLTQCSSTETYSAWQPDRCSGTTPHTSSPICISSRTDMPRRFTTPEKSRPSVNGNSIFVLQRNIFNSVEPYPPAKQFIVMLANQCVCVWQLDIPIIATSIGFTEAALTSTRTSCGLLIVGILMCSLHWSNSTLPYSWICHPFILAGCFECCSGSFDDDDDDDHLRKIFLRLMAGIRWPYLNSDDGNLIVSLLFAVQSYCVPCNWWKNPINNKQQLNVPFDSWSNVKCTADDMWRW